MIKKRWIFFILVFGIFILSGINASVNASERHYIRVGLFYANTSEDSYEITFENGARLAKLDGKDVINGQEYEDARILTANFRDGYAEFILKDMSGYEIKRFDLSEANMVKPYDFDGEGSFKIKGKSYRGAVLFNDLKNTLNVIDYVDEEKYLYGVVGNEIGKSAPLEAQKAQATASRSYARVKLKTHENYGFDICATPHCQYYKGKDSENSLVVRAVDDTFGKTVKYNGNTVAAFYSKNSGGYISASEDIWNEKLGYLKSKEDIYSPDFAWKKQFSKREIEAKLLNAGKSVGNLKAVRVKERADSGIVKKLDFIGEDATVTLEKDKIRSALGTSDIKSLMFTFQGDLKNVKTNNQADFQDINAQKQYVSVIGRDTENSIEISGDTACIASDYGISGVYNKKLSNLNGISEAGFFVLPGAQNVADKDAQISKNNKNLFEKIGGIDYVEISEGLSITGLGYGHGVGMSQDGAIQMANRGFSYEEILKYYYCDITVD